METIRNKMETRRNRIILNVDETGYLCSYMWQSTPWKDDRCDCDRHLHSAYVYIIDCLKEAKLLPQSYKMMCCFCHLLACVGFEIPEEWEGGLIVEDHEEDCDYDEFTLIQIKTKYLPTGEHFRLIVRIHDIPKVLKTGRMIEDVKCVRTM